MGNWDVAALQFIVRAMQASEQDVGGSSSLEPIHFLCIRHILHLREQLGCIGASEHPVALGGIFSVDDSCWPYHAVTFVRTSIAQERSASAIEPKRSGELAAK